MEAKDIELSHYHLSKAGNILFPVDRSFSRSNNCYLFKSTVYRPDGSVETVRVHPERFLKRVTIYSPEEYFRDLEREKQKKESKEEDTFNFLKFNNTN